MTFKLLLGGRVPGTYISGGVTYDTVLSGRDHYESSGVSDRTLPSSCSPQA